MQIMNTLIEETRHLKPDDTGLVDEFKHNFTLRVLTDLAKVSIDDNKRALNYY